MFWIIHIAHCFGQKIIIYIYIYHISYIKKDLDFLRGRRVHPTLSTPEAALQRKLQKMPWPQKPSKNVIVAVNVLLCGFGVVTAAVFVSRFQPTGH